MKKSKQQSSFSVRALVVLAGLVSGAASPTIADEILTVSEVRTRCDIEGEDFNEQFCVGFLLAGVNASDVIGSSCVPSGLTGPALHFLFVAGSENEIEVRPEAADMPAVQMIMALAELQYPCSGG